MFFKSHISSDISIFKMRAFHSNKKKSSRKVCKTTTDKISMSSKDFLRYSNKIPEFY